MSTTHKKVIADLGNGLTMSVALCGVDDNGNCYYTDIPSEVDCKRCLKILNKKGISS